MDLPIFAIAEWATLLVHVSNFGGRGRVGGLRMCHPPYHPP